ncbi:tyrosine-type recombinase/integrase [Acidovorax sp. Leaf84]|uniref:tyrosine-type recombinase/integrase n=1 Tax=Acidovorax sp. Leaf84 TaxID=1736240 RepID=UPI00138F146F|nr:site-specific integrase [Acidovorax sp. Leaf84]
MGDDQRPIQPMQSFLLWALLERGKLLKPLTWDVYGRAIWDFASFLYANELKWDEFPKTWGDSVVARYRDWSLFELRLRAKTVNARLRIVVAFYEWARTEQHIAFVPFIYDEKSKRNAGFLAHVQNITAKSKRAALLLSEWESPPEFLATDQIRICRATLASTSHRLLFDLMVRVGLRSCEARTFPLKYVFNPARRADCTPARMIVVRLDPRDMLIKYDKPREVHIPYGLMCELHAYSLYERNRALGIDGDEAPVFLTAYGRPFSKSAIAEMMARLRRKVGFPVNALMLRHSYAVHTLLSLRKSSDYFGEPLLYVRDRLGHSSVETTTIYLRQIERLTGDLINAIESEFTMLFRETNGVGVA